VVREAPLEDMEHGLLPNGDGWFVLNARDARWHHLPGRDALCVFEGTPPFAQLGINLHVLPPGEQMSLYHWEADQEDFLVLAGEALLIVEGEGRPLRPWDFAHCPPGTSHVLIGAGTVPCLVLAVGAREHAGEADWGGYPVDETALRHGAGVTEATSDRNEAYAGFEPGVPTRYLEGWLPDF
jgi:uncharacterized cupin superfamily protein